MHLKKLKKASEVEPSAEANLIEGELVVGNIVKHLKFGRGEVLKIEGKGADIKAEIRFSVWCVKRNYYYVLLSYRLLGRFQ